MITGRTNSLWGDGAEVLGRSASAGFAPSNNISANKRFWSCQAASISGDGGGKLFASTGDVSRAVKFSAKITTQIAASPAQMRRYGRMSSRQQFRTIQRSADRSAAGRRSTARKPLKRLTLVRQRASTSLKRGVNERRVSCLRSAAFSLSITARRSESSPVSAARCRSSRISRGVFTWNAEVDKRFIRLQSDRGDEV